VLRVVGLGTTLLRAQKELFGITMSSDLELSDIALDPRHQKGEADLRAEPAASGAAETSVGEKCRAVWSEATFLKVLQQDQIKTLIRDGNLPLFSIS